MKRAFALIWVMLTLCCAPYPPDTPESEATQTITEVELEQHLVRLAGKETQGRATASEGFRLAADYVIEQLTAYGVAPGHPSESGEKVWQQPVPLERVAYGSGSVLRFLRDGGGPELSEGRGMLVLNPGRGPTQVEGPPLFVGFGIENPELDWDDYAGMKLDGRIAVLMGERPSPERTARSLSKDGWDALNEGRSRLENLAAKGPAAILMVPTRRDLQLWEVNVDRNLRMPLFPLDRYSIDQPPLLPMPVILLGESAAKWLFAGSEFDPLSSESVVKPQELTEVHANLRLDVEKIRTRCANVIGMVEGTDPDLSSEVVVVSAHLDHMGTSAQGVLPGANDDASGCAAILEVLQAIAAGPFRRTVMGVFTTGEEIGHFGSLHFVTHLPFERRKLFRAVTLEHLGRIEKKSDGLEIVALTSDHEILQRTKPWLLDMPVQWGDIEHDRTGKVRGSDTQSFRAAGLPVILLGGGGFPDYHSPDDTVEQIDLKHLRFTAKLTYDVLETMANAEIQP